MAFNLGGILQGGLGGFATGGPVGGLIGAGAGLLGGLFGSGQKIDPYQEQQRRMAMNAANLANAGPAGGGSWFANPLGMEDINAAMNPYIQNVVGGVESQYDRARAQAATAANQQATLQGAFGGSRAAVTQGARLGALDRAQAQDVAGLLSSGFGNAVNLAEMQRQQRQQQLQEPLWRAQQGLAFSNAGAGPYMPPSQQNPFALGAGAGSLYASSRGGPALPPWSSMPNPTPELAPWSVMNPSPRVSSVRSIY